ncbi:MAG: hypothetical protein AB1540_14710 [Bdellovibrionota bacterium]
MTKVWSNLAALVFVLGSTQFLAACNSTENNPEVPAGVSDGSTLAPNTPDNPSPSPDPNEPGDPDPTPNPNPNAMTVAVKYVALQSEATSAPTPSKASVEALIQNMSNAWAQCDIRFVLEEYIAPVASAHGVDFTPANHSQLYDLRREFADSRRALFVKTGTWDRSGNLGSDGSNGFSTMPGTEPTGVVFESRVATSTLLLSHEAGHLIGGLGHTTTSTNLMNHYITSSTTRLTSSQCDYARDTLVDHFSSWLR